MNKYRCGCGARKDAKSTQCRQCRNLAAFEHMRAQPISQYICSHPETKAKYNNIRKWARMVMERIGPAKQCHICNFDVVVEVCHIKAIRDFSITALMGEVNSLNNLVYLCPNHHAMFDKGLIEVYAPIG